MAKKTDICLIIPPSVKYEHSMGMGNVKIPDFILKASR